MSHDVTALGLLSRERDVYVYDQLGAGRSTRLADPSGYTERRAVEDLGRVVRFTGAERVVLLGHSWGARLVLRYAVTQPNRVSAVVLSAPGFPPTKADGAKVGDPARRLSDRDRIPLYGQLLRPRNLFLYALGKADPKVAHQAAGDEEMDARFARIYEKTTPGLFCDPPLAGRLGIEGVGHFAHDALATSNVDPLPAAELATITAPVLLVKPSCDYLPWSVVTAYAGLLPQTRVVVLPGAGHQAYNEEPQAYADVVDAFLTGRPLPYPPVRADVVPDSYSGER
jgi:pimeloyl-ACP methyl ester carboxylesterase